mgnify:CR=1 FL=1
MASVSLPHSQSIPRIVVRTLLILIPLIAVWLLVAPFYSELIFRAGEVALSVDPATDVAIAQYGKSAPTVYNLKGPTEQPVFRFDRVGLFFNTIVVLALMLAVPGWRWPTRLTRLGMAVGLLFSTHVLFVVLQTKAQFINLDLTETSEEMAYLINWLAVLFGPIGEALFPLAIGFALSWRAWGEVFGLRIRFDMPPAGTVGRNDSCPCGSGRKYKRCCDSR